MMFVIALIASVSFAQKYTESYRLLNEILGYGAIAVGEAQKADFETVKIDVDLVGFGGDRSKNVLKHLSNEFTYNICCFVPPSIVEDVDVKVYYITKDGEYILVASDEDVTSSAIFDFKPSVTGSYVLNISAYKMVPGYENRMTYYCLTMVHD